MTPAYHVRGYRPGDLGFLREMLYEAACWRPDGPRPPLGEALSDPRLARYLEDWGRPGDAVLIAAERRSGAPVGAAWYRLFPPERPGYGFVDASTPEVAVGVAAEHRGRGVGAMLLRALVRAARAGGFGALSLGVEEDNPALKLYRRLGFEEVSRADGALTMRLPL